MGQAIPRPEYPRPQMVREGWMNLNGEWDFEFDFGVSGKQRNFQTEGVFSKKITVPFCPESCLSGVQYTDFIPALWYRRNVSLSAEQVKGRVLLHFGAVDYHCEAWVNGIHVGSHDGGYTSFTFEVTKAVKEGENTIVIYGEDDVRSGNQPRGKQSALYYSHNCDYTRTTGIWQTVWMEFVPDTYLASYQVTGDPANQNVRLDVEVSGNLEGYTVTAEASYHGKPMGKRQAAALGFVSMEIPLEECHLWDVRQPELYDITITLSQNGQEADQIKGYFGLRSIELKDKKIYLNGRPVFQRLILDQGFYPDGIYTAPSDEALKKDIELSFALGFNGARLHQKVFEPRFLYWADQMGYLVWGEQANWGLDITKADGLLHFLPEWVEAVKRDYNHPAIVGWCPFNETWDDGETGARQINGILETVYRVTKALDPTRPVIDTSGNFHVATDIYDIHEYQQDPEVFRGFFAPMEKGGEPYETFPQRQKYEGQPYFVSEYGGTWWDSNPEDEKAWGYGNRPASEEEACARITGLTAALLENPGMCALCYTQLYDVEQEKNGLYTYDRKPKFSDETYAKIKAAFSAKAAIE